MTKKKRRELLLRDIFILLVSITVAALLGRSLWLEQFLGLISQTQWLVSFIVGLLFVSVFTVAPASVIFVKLASLSSPWWVTLWATCGATVGDYIIFRFVRKRAAQDLSLLLTSKARTKISSLFQLRLLKWLVPVIGAFLIASPLPDELGLTLLGLSKIRPLTFVFLTFFLNLAGLLLITAVFS